MIGQTVTFLDYLNHNGIVVGGLYGNVTVISERRFGTSNAPLSEEELMQRLVFENTLLGTDANINDDTLLVKALKNPIVPRLGEEDSFTITATAMLSVPQKPKNGISVSVNPAVTFYSGPHVRFGEAFAVAFPPVETIKQVLTETFSQYLPEEVMEELIMDWMWKVRGLDLS